MSLDATRWAWGVSGIRPAWKLVLLSLADRAGEARTCWPSLGRLAADTGLDLKTVRRALNELCGRGLISRDSRPGRGYVYTLPGVRGGEGASVRVPSSIADFPAAGDSSPGAAAAAGAAACVGVPPVGLATALAGAAAAAGTSSPCASVPSPEKVIAPGIAAAAPPKEAAGRSRKRQDSPAANGSLNDQQSATNPQDNSERSRADGGRLAFSGQEAVAGAYPGASGAEEPGPFQAGREPLSSGNRAPAVAAKRGGVRRQALGEFGNVRLSPDELARLEADFSPERTREAVALLDLHLGAKRGADPYKSHYLAMRKWVFDALWEREARKARFNGAAGRPGGGALPAGASGISGSAVRTFQQQAEDSVWAGFDRLLADEDRPGGGALERSEGCADAKDGAGGQSPEARLGAYAGAAR